MKILIVEDQAPLRRLMRYAVDGQNHDVVEAADAAAGWALAVEHRPDVALLDIMMPGAMDGLDLCRLLKSDPRTCDARVVMISARGHRNDLLIGDAAGADAYLVKPFSPHRLAEVVDALHVAA
jgi:DNA-binding response OmpR family regulator